MPALKKMFVLTACLVALLLILQPAVPQSAQPDLVLVNAHVITMAPKQPTAEAIAMHQNRIVWVGNSDEAKKLFGSNVRRVDLRGATVLPGIIDAHTHLV